MQQGIVANLQFEGADDDVYLPAEGGEEARPLPAPPTPTHRQSSCGGSTGRGWVSICSAWCSWCTAVSWSWLGLGLG